MFGIDSAELLIIAVVALVVIGPKDLPRVMRTIGNFVARARGMATHFRAGIDNMVRESELAEMEKQWQAQNERIMRQYPAAASPDSDWGHVPPASPAAPAPERHEAPPASASQGPRRRSAPPAPPGRKRPPLPPRPRELP